MIWPFISSNTYLPARPDRLHRCVYSGLGLWQQGVKRLLDPQRGRRRRRASRHVFICLTTTVNFVSFLASLLAPTGALYVIVPYYFFMSRFFSLFFNFFFRCFSFFEIFSPSRFDIYDTTLGFRDIGTWRFL